MLERGGSQQFQTNVVGQHVGECQAQLGIAVQGCLGAGHLGAVELDITAVLVGSGGDGAGTQDEVASLVGVGNRGCERQGNERGAEQGLVHGSSQRTFRIEWVQW
ncbi:hypothetical protein D9M70_653160 [compost metagenome]